MANIDLPADFSLCFIVFPPVERGLLVEGVGLCVEAPVKAARVETAQLSFAVVPGEAGLVIIEIRRATTGWLLPTHVVEKIRAVWAGLRALGLTMEAAGDWAEHFPPGRARRNIKSPGIPWMMSRRLAPSGPTEKRTKVRPETLLGIHQAFEGAVAFEEIQRAARFKTEFPAHQDVAGLPIRETLLVHASGLEVLVKVNEGLVASHQITGRLAPLPETQKKTLYEIGRKISAGSAATATVGAATEGASTSTRTSTSVSITVQPFAALFPRMGKKHAPFLRALAEEFEAVDMQSDFGRYPRSPLNFTSMDLPGGEVCRAGRQSVTLGLLLRSGIPAEVLQKMGVPPGTPLDSPEPFKNWFAVECGPHVLWGDNGRARMLVWNEEPAAIYTF